MLCAVNASSHFTDEQTETQTLRNVSTATHSWKVAEPRFKPKLLVSRAQLGPEQSRVMGKVGSSKIRARCSVFAATMVQEEMGFFLTQGPCTLSYCLCGVGGWMYWGYFLRAQRAPSFPRFVLGRVTGILQLKVGSSWEWRRACCFWKSSHYLGKSILNIVNDGEVEKNSSYGDLAC